VKLNSLNSVLRRRTRHHAQGTPRGLRWAKDAKPTGSVSNFTA